jgi:MFS family permease
VNGPGATGPSTRQRVVEVLGSTGFRRLFATRATSQLGDGLFQLAAAALLLFEHPGRNPALTLTALVAVTLIPFSALVPFAGVFIDRWDRRRILTLTPVVRAILAALLPLAAIRGKEGPLFYAIALVVLSANRLFLATLSAVLPQLVPGRDLLVANSVAATGGSLANVSGLALGALVAHWSSGRLASIVASIAFAGAAVLARGIPVRSERRGRARAMGQELRVVLGDLLEGFRRVRRSQRVSFAMSAVGMGQILVGYTTGVTAVVFIARLHLDTASVGALLGAVGFGLGLGVVAVPLVGRKLRPDTIVPISFSIGGIGVLVSASSLTRGRMTVGAVIVGLSYAFAKIPVDTIVQEDMPDAFRGRAFAVYDMLFNVARVAGTAIAAGFVEASFRVGRLMIGGGFCYFLASAALGTWARRITGVRWSRRSHIEPGGGPISFGDGEVVTVRAYAGSRADEEPRAIVVAGREIPVADIDWRATVERDGERRRVFIARVGGARIRLAHVESSSLWEVERTLAPPTQVPT